MRGCDAIVAASAGDAASPNSASKPNAMVEISRGEGVAATDYGNCIVPVKISLLFHMANLPEATRQAPKEFQAVALLLALPPLIFSRQSGQMPWVKSASVCSAR